MMYFLAYLFAVYFGYYIFYPVLTSIDYFLIHNVNISDYKSWDKVPMEIKRGLLDSLIIISICIWSLFLYAFTDHYYIAYFLFVYNSLMAWIIFHLSTKRNYNAVKKIVRYRAFINLILLFIFLIS